MKTFVTSSLLAILSAVVLAGYLVKTGEDVPRRSPHSYPPLVTEPVPRVTPEVELVETEEKKEEETTVVPSVEESAEVEEKDTGTEASELSKSQEAVRSKLPPRVALEPHGPPGPSLPFVLNINAAESDVSLQGSIPKREIQLAIMEAVTEAFEEREIIDRLKFSPDTRSGLWIRYLPEFVGRYFQYTGGNHEMTIVDGRLILSGAVATEECKEVVLEWARPFLRRGLDLDDFLDVDEALKGKIPEIPEELAKSRPKPKREQSQPEVKVASVGDEIAESAEEQPAETGGSKESEDLVFLAPFDEEYEVHTVPNLTEGETQPEASVSELVPAGGSVAQEPESEKAAEKPFVDKGGPLIFEFDSPTGEIANSDRPKIDAAIKRAQRPRSIVYVTGYSDYRGSFEENQKLALGRANRIKELIFAGEIADEVTAEVKTKGDTLSQKRPGRETEAQLKRSRRVVVEVYHLR